MSTAYLAQDISFKISAIYSLDLTLQVVICCSGCFRCPSVLSRIQAVAMLSQTSHGSNLILLCCSLSHVGSDGHIEDWGLCLINICCNSEIKNIYILICSLTSGGFNQTNSSVTNPDKLNLIRFAVCSERILCHFAILYCQVYCHHCKDCRSVVWGSCDILISSVYRGSHVYESGQQP